MTLTKKLTLGVVLIILAVIVIGGFRFYNFFVKYEIQKIDDNFFVAVGGGGNTAVLVSKDSVLVVDTKIMFAAKNLLADIAKLTGNKPIKYVINTHFHPDHAGGNDLYPRGTIIIAHPASKRRMMEEKVSEVSLPTVLVSDSLIIPFADDTVRIYHVGPAHTDGDLVVLFQKRKILQTGDVFFNHIFPNIDPTHSGANTKSWIVAIDTLQRLRFDTIIPGHGQVCGRAELKDFQNYLKDLVQAVSETEQGRPLSKVKNDSRLEKYDYDVVPFFTSLDKNIDAVHNELMKK
jgi:cyclase